jgi:hypothetical protein
LGARSLRQAEHGRDYVSIGEGEHLLATLAGMVLGCGSDPPGVPHRRDGPRSPRQRGHTILGPIPQSLLDIFQRLE